MVEKYLGPKWIQAPNQLPIAAWRVDIQLESFRDLCIHVLALGPLFVSVHAHHMRAWCVCISSWSQRLAWVRPLPKCPQVPSPWTAVLHSCGGHRQPGLSNPHVQDYEAAGRRPDGCSSQVRVDRPLAGAGGQMWETMESHNPKQTHGSNSQVTDWLSIPSCFPQIEISHWNLCICLGHVMSKTQVHPCS